MERRLVVAALGVLLCAAPAAAQITNFSRDVTTSIDRGIEWLNAQGAYDNNSRAGDAAGLAAIALLEKRESADIRAEHVGYRNALPRDKARLDRVMGYIINRSRNAGFYAYRDGGDLMALSIYAVTGGPDAAAAVQSANNIVDRIVRNQNGNGYWCYTNGGCSDSSKTWSSLRRICHSLLYSARSRAFRSCPP